jgi:Kef-type K+ transport system membrane component KefB
MISKFVGVYPVTRRFASPKREAMYTTMLMSTGLTFGSISALFGLSHGIVDQVQYSFLIAAVIGSAIVPTLIANAFFLPHHLIEHGETQPHAAAHISPAQQIPEQKAQPGKTAGIR